MTAVAVDGLDLDGLDYVMGGATIGAVGTGLLGCVAAMLVGGSIAFYIRTTGRLSPYLRIGSLPLMFAAMVTMAATAALATAGVDFEDGTRGLEALGGVVLGTVEVTSEAWQLVCRVSVALFAVGFAGLGVAGRQLVAQRRADKGA